MPWVVKLIPRDLDDYYTLLEIVDEVCENDDTLQYDFFKPYIYIVVMEGREGEKAKDRAYKIGVWFNKKARDGERLLEPKFAVYYRRLKWDSSKWRYIIESKEDIDEK